MATKTGKVKFFDQTRGFGFIVADEGGKDVFVHKTGVQQGDAIAEGDLVEYDTEPGKGGKGPCAVGVHRI